MTATARASALRVYILSRFASSVGVSVYASVGPLIAALMFDANPAQIGLITSTSMVTSILFRLPAAGVIDRVGAERRIMRNWGIISAIASALVPGLWLLGVLNFWSFLACVAISGIVTSVLGAAGHRMVSTLAMEGERTRAIGLLNSAGSSGDIVGQSGGGLLVGLIPPPLSLMFSSIASLVGVALLPKESETSRIQSRDASVGGQESSILDALRTTAGSLVRVMSRRFIVVTLIVGVAGSVIEPVVVLYLLRVASVHPSLVGVAIGIGAAGGVLGGLLVGPAISRYGFTGSFLVATVAMAVGTLILMLLGPIDGWGFVAAVFFELLTAAGGTVAIAGSMGRLQEETGQHEIARVMSGASLALEITGLAGIGLGVLLAEFVDLRAAFVASLVVYLLAVGAILPTGALRRIRS